MENAIDALKLAFGIVVFILGLTLLFRTASLARETATTLITEADRTTYYTYVPNENNPIQENKQGKNDEVTVVNRIVTLEDIIPTLYRYSLESYGVTIIDKRNNLGRGIPEVVTRFERETENLCSTFSHASTTLKNNIIHEINTYVLEPVEIEKIEDQTDLQDLFKRIYAQEPYGDNLDYECSWSGTNQWIAQRIDSDLSRNKSIF